MTFDKFNSQSLVQFFNQYQKQLHLLVVVLLCLYLIAFAAKLVWRIIPEPEITATPALPTQKQTAALSDRNGVNLRQLQQLNLFGSVDKTAPAEETTPVTDAPQTKLNLTLTGVVASSEIDEAAAIIENKGSQAVYGLGEKIEGTNATLNQVLQDRVIIKNGVRHETLMLDGIDFEEANRRRSSGFSPTPNSSNPLPTRAVPAAGSTRRLESEAAEVTNTLREQPASFTDYISISPKTENGQLVGYQVKPGKNPVLFESAGLKAGDVVVQINGMDLTDTQQSMEAMNELRNAQTIELTMTRDGEYITVYLDMPEPEAE
ncbi:type II secretion system protein GspC [Alteromonas pelagimontana]|uniref:Type II secretion system protein GspC n=1 Tax=Alteromonas pelagimontana TaxID=1858656 RepID=A0A6M4MC88_9ALTE|nr:type II secretion system protein GspC [Alteromonas pelagimontana]QJR80811.1 type II secretion system protein GspC [Alteromonas pelagimontana]